MPGHSHASGTPSSVHIKKQDSDDHHYYRSRQPRGQRNDHRQERNDRSESRHSGRDSNRKRDKNRPDKDKREKGRDNDHHSSPNHISPRGNRQHHNRRQSEHAGQQCDALKATITDEDIKARPPIPTYTVPLYRERLVLLKIADNFLRLGDGSKPVISRLKPPLYPNVENDVMMAPNARSRRQFHQMLSTKKTKRPFNYQDFTFVADESCTLSETWYRNARCFSHMRFGVKRDQKGSSSIMRKSEYLCAIRNDDGKFEIVYGSHPYSSWWRLTALSQNQYVAESVQFQGHCLMKDSLNQLTLSPKLKNADRRKIARSKFDPERTITITTLPDFAVWHPGVIVN